MTSDTIAAIASGLSDSGISVIRISGDEAFTVAERIFRSATGKSFSDMSSFSVNYGYIVDEGETVDEVLMLKMKAPHTYTREDVIEIDCHGGILVTKRVLETVIRNGARVAEPGEFTKRAFLNGRIDLSQAEAVADIIHSKSELSLKNSIKQLRGNVRQKISSLREAILKKTAYIEAALDDPEHISLDGFSDRLEAELRDIRSQISELIDSYDNGRMMKEGINTVILGRPNAGKSSLLNSLLGEDRAIVTDIAGTTRDTLEETIDLSGLVLNIIDTAGIRSTGDTIEQIGVDRAFKAASQADLILYVVDMSEALDKDDMRIIELLKDHKHIVLLNKTDLNSAVTTEDSLRKYSSAPMIGISARTGEGVDRLKNTITDMFFSGQVKINDEIYITNLRQKEYLMNAASAIDRVFDSIEAAMPEDFLSIDLMDAYRNLGLITGEDVEDDLADKIFSEFCMGK